MTGLGFDGLFILRGLSAHLQQSVEQAMKVVPHNTAPGVVQQGVAILQRPLNVAGLHSAREGRRRTGPRLVPRALTINQPYPSVRRSSRRVGGATPEREPA